MNNETLIKKLLDLAEGRETPESWWSWWDEHECVVVKYNCNTWFDKSKMQISSQTE